jgi:hypothetical protein
METTITLIAELIIVFKQLHIVMEARNLWTLAAMTTLLLKGKRAQLYVLAKALPCKGKLDSRVQKLRRWVSNLKITPEQSLSARLNLLAPLLSQLPALTLIIDRTQWTRLGVQINLFLCSIAFKGRSLPIYWTFLPKRGCSSFEDQKALLNPVLAALAAHPILSQIPTKVVADREFCSPKLPRWLKGFGIRFCLRVKKSYRVSRPDIPSRPIRVFLKHCPKGEYCFFTDIFLTEEHHFRCNLFVSWREDCQEPIALITDIEEATVVNESYRERMFIETFNRDLKSGGYDIEHGKMTDSKRLANFLIPIAFAYILSVIQGHVEELIEPLPPLKKRTLSLFSKARNRMIDLLERTSFSVIREFFQQFFQFLFILLLQKSADTVTNVFRSYAKQQSLLLEGIP